MKFVIDGDALVFLSVCLNISYLLGELLKAVFVIGILLL